MAEWTGGYLAEIDYTCGYYNELNPLRTRLALLNTGIAPPTIRSACELGFGQGLSINLHAAASTVEWHGTDFNPRQAAHAQNLAQASGARAHLYDDSFADFCARRDLPDFDFIGLHGIWSWIDDKNRALIVDFLQRKLRLGGVLYLSYNALPGWGSFTPLRCLLTEHADRLGGQGQGVLARIDSALGFAERLLATGPRFARANPQVAQRLEAFKNKNRNYLAHEFFNRDWEPMHFSQMARALEDARLQYVCSARYNNHIDALNLSAAQQAFLQEISDPILREDTRDFMVNEQFRLDYWVKGARALTPLERRESLRQQRVLLAVPRDGIALTTQGVLGEATLHEAIYRPLLDQLAGQSPKTLGEIEQALGGQGVALAQIVQAALVLSHDGRLVAVQEDETIAAARQQTGRLNAHLLEQARLGRAYSHLASPLTGGGVALGSIEQMFVASALRGENTIEAWARSAWKTLQGQGQKLVKDDKPLESAEENQAELARVAQQFAQNRMPALRALQVL